MPPAERIGNRFVLGAFLGAGAMGEVYAAWDERDARTVAVKRLRPDALRDAALVERFAREGALLRAAAHPSIVSVLAVLPHDPAGPAIVMEHVAGGSLETLLDREPRLPVERVLALALDLSDALARAHRLGIVHRDLKPANVLLAADGSPRLTDFGVAHLAGAVALTGTGAVLGTLPYLSPEGWDGAEPDARTDVWAFGVMLYEMLAGRRPFQGRFPGLLHAAIAAREPEPLRALRPDVPAALADTIALMLEKDPERRMGSVRELGVLAERLLGPSGVRPLPAWAGTVSPPLSAPRVCLPTPPTPLVGRAREVAAIVERLAHPDVRLLTLTGAGGSGKTRVAIAAAAAAGEHFPGGVTFVDLTAVGEPALVLPTLAHALGVEEDLYRPLHELLAERLSGPRTLVVLDNVEQLVGAGPELARLVAAAPSLTLLVTSRFLLRIAAEHAFAVPPLSLAPANATDEALLASEAGALFVSRARAAAPSLAVDARAAAAIAAICARLDGLPLALELAAARVRVLPPDRLLAQLERPLVLLAGGGEDRAPHQRALRSTIVWSYDLLDERDRALFARLAVFAGDWTLADAAAVLALDGSGADAALALAALVDGLQSLAEKSFVLSRGARTIDGEPCYGMLQTLREFARERLAATADGAAIAERHARHFLAEAVARDERVPTAEQAAAIGWFAAAHDDLRAALAWADAHDAPLLLAGVSAMGRFWYLAGHWHEALGWYRRALARAGGAPAARAAILDQMGRLEMFLGDEAAALAHHEAALAAAGAGDARLRARAGEGLGEVLLKVGDAPRAGRVLEDAVRVARADGHAGTLAGALATLATARVAAGEMDAAEPLLREALALGRAQGDRFLLTKVHYALAGLALLRGDAAGARALCEAGRPAAVDSGDTSWACHLDEMLARALAASDEWEGAVPLAAHSLHAFHAVGSRSCLPHSLEAAARLCVARASAPRAPVGADRAGELARAAQLVGAADAVCAALGIAMLPVERALLEQTRATVREALGPAYAAAYDEGRGWSEADAIVAAVPSR